MDSSNDSKRWTTPSVCHLRFDELSTIDPLLATSWQKLPPQKSSTKRDNWIRPWSDPRPASPANRYHTVCLFRLTASATFLPVISLFLFLFLLLIPSSFILLFHRQGLTFFLSSFDFKEGRRNGFLSNRRPCRTGSIAFLRIKKGEEKERKKWLSLSRYGSSTWRTIDLPETKSFSLRGHGWTPRAVCSLPTFLRLFPPKACNLTSDCSPSSSLISWLIESFWSLKPLRTACLLAGAFVRAGVCARVCLLCSIVR